MKAYLGAGVAGLIVASIAGTASAHDGKIKLGLRVGYALPAGHISGERHAGALTIGAQKLSDNVTDQVPFGVDVGYLVIPNLTLGAYGQYGFNVRTPTNCSGCGAHDLRFGLQGQLHFAPEQSVDPWLGVGFGYELLRFSENATIRGWELLNLQGGVDFRAASSLTVGPFLGLSLGEFTRTSMGDDVDPKALHEWITLGVKGTYGI